MSDNTEIIGVVDVLSAAEHNVFVAGDEEMASIWIASFATRILSKIRRTFAITLL